MPALRAMPVLPAHCVDRPRPYNRRSGSHDELDTYRERQCASVDEHVAAAPATASDYSFLIRRLHSLTGLVPIGAYLVVHLFTNASILAGPEAFQDNVDRIHQLEKMKILWLVEWVFIFIPILFHGILGVMIWLQATPNPYQYQYAANIRYSLQRWTGLIAGVFIAYHVWQFHWLFRALGGGAFDAHDAAVSTARTLQASGWIAPFYAIGVLASVYHLANGIWTSLITWGVTIGPRSQRVSGYACTALGLVLGLVGLGALSGFKAFEVNGRARPGAEARHVTLEGGPPPLDVGQ
jgi:succinate dehydrogenase / fumarate reductase cytochrome b subunit